MNKKMVISDNGKNRTRDLLSSDITSTEVGSDGTSPTTGDTTLGSKIVGSEKIPTVSTSNKTINTSSTWYSTELNGETIAESNVIVNTTTQLDRFVFPDFDKTSTNELNIIDVMKIL